MYTRRKQWGELLRELNYGAGCLVRSVAIDGKGVLYIYQGSSDYPTNSNSVLSEYAANVSGAAPPVLTIPNINLANLVGDAAGNLRAILNPGTVGGNHS